MGVDNDIVEGISFLSKEAVKNATYDKTFNGVITKVNSDGTYDVKVNTIEYTMPLYISRTLTVNQKVKVVVPQNQWNNAFIL